MNKIETRILNCSAISEAEKNMVFAARLTQRGHSIHSMDDLIRLYNKSFSEETLRNISQLPHPTVQKFSVITVAVVGASRRFLSQITRHQNEVKYMSASLQYSNYSGNADFVIPYDIMKADTTIQSKYIENCQSTINCYEELCQSGIDHDSSGYAIPQALRNALLISATPYQWKHMIGQRTCRRNSDEMRIVMLNIWNNLFELSPILFDSRLTGPYCQRNKCLEGKMTCTHSLDSQMTPMDILFCDYPLIYGGSHL